MIESADNQKLASPEEVLAINDVGYEYQSNRQVIQALEHINLKVFKNEFVCILGPSGCGKSTLLGIIAGFLKASAGSITMDGQPVQSPDWHRGVVFQNAALYPWLTVRQNVEFGLKMRGVPLAIRRPTVDDCLARVRLSDYASLRPYELSGGMKQRVSIARVIANQPRIMLMDEPFGALDAMTREQMQSLIRTIWLETRTTILFVTHDIDEALLLGTRVLVLSKRPGKIIKEFKADFTLLAQGDQQNDPRHSKQFLDVRREIIQLIYSNQKDLIL